MYPHQAITAEIARQRRTDLIATADSFRRARALRAERGSWPHRRTRRQFRLTVLADSRAGLT